MTPTAPKFEEAPASFNFPVQFITEDEQLWAAGLTIRANSGPEAIEALMETLKYGAWRCRMQIVKTPAPQPGPARRVPAEPEPSLDRLPPAPGTPAAAEQRPAADRPAPTPPAGSSVYYAIKLTVSPLPEGKVKLEWQAAGRRFADIRKTCTMEAACDLLQSTGEAWRMTDFTAAKVFNIRHAITWHEGRPMQGGGFYKDIDTISSY